MKTFFLCLAMLGLSLNECNAQVASADYSLLSVLPLVTLSLEKDNFKDAVLAAVIAEKHTNAAEKQLKNYLSRSLRYSDQMVKNGIEGEAIVVIDLSGDGTLTSFTITESPHREVTKMVEDALQNLTYLNFKNHWYRGRQQVEIPLSFSLR